MSCCDTVDPLIRAIHGLLAVTDKQYLSQELRNAASDALLAVANAEARICTVCWKNVHAAGGYYGTFSGKVGEP